MDDFRYKVAQAAVKAMTNDALAVQLRILMERGQKAEWRQAVLEEAANRLEVKIK